MVVIKAILVEDRSICQALAIHKNAFFAKPQIKASREKFEKIIGINLKSFALDNYL